LDRHDVGTAGLQGSYFIISTRILIILSQTLRTPSRRLKFLTNEPGNFKFGDFYESFGGGVEPDCTDNMTCARENLNAP
jgi:8-oxo-dGTP pyrophosphatase MutT (NUDIX family)